MTSHPPAWRPRGRAPAPRRAARAAAYARVLLRTPLACTCISGAACACHSPGCSSTPYAAQALGRQGPPAATLALPLSTLPFSTPGPSLPGCGAPELPARRAHSRAPHRTAPNVLPALPPHKEGRAGPRPRARGCTPRPPRSAPAPRLRARFRIRICTAHRLPCPVAGKAVVCQKDLGHAPPASLAAGAARTHPKRARILLSCQASGLWLCTVGQACAPCLGVTPRLVGAVFTPPPCQLAGDLERMSRRGGAGTHEQQEGSGGHHTCTPCALGDARRQITAGNGGVLLTAHPSAHVIPAPSRGAQQCTRPVHASPRACPGACHSCPLVAPALPVALCPACAGLCIAHLGLRQACCAQVRAPLALFPAPSSLAAGDRNTAAHNTRNGAFHHSAHATTGAPRSAARL